MEGLRSAGGGSKCARFPDLGRKERRRSIAAGHHPHPSGFALSNREHR